MRSSTASPRWIYRPNAVTIVIMLGVAVMGLLASCRHMAPSGKPLVTARARFFLESNDPDAIPVVLPQSGVRLMISPRPVLTEGDITNVELAQVELGRCLVFQLTPAAARDLYRMSVPSQGRRLVLLVNDATLGARRIDGALVDGVIFIFVEMPDTELPSLVANLKASAVALQKAIRSGS